MEGERKRITDGFATLERGCHEGKNPSLLAASQVARAINATFRGGLWTCRPAFTRFPLNFANAEQAAWFREHNVQGRFIYRSALGKSFLIYSVGGRIFRVDADRPNATNVLELTADDLNPANRPRAWMEQASHYLVIQDGQSKPFIFNGSTLRRSALGQPSYEVPVGTAMTYGLGRLVVVRPHRRSYVVGDILNGGTEVIQFTENNFLNEGGDIPVPVDGDITAVKILAQIDRSTGQGDLMVFTNAGAASARIGERRDQWKNIQFQLVAMLGAGATSQNSVSLVNGDLFCRSLDGIRSLAMTRSEFQNSWSKTPLSREVNRTLSYDTPFLFDFAESAVFDNRLLTLCNQSPLPNGCYHRGIIALDFDLISGMGDKAPPAYDGLWVGLNFTSIVAGQFASGERCFVTHRNGDGENELWELTRDGTADNGTRRIVSSVEGAALLKAGSQPLALKRLDGGDIGLEGIVGRVDVSVSFRPDNAQCWVPWHTFNICATAPSCTTVCSGGKVQPQYRTKKRFPQPPDDCEAGDNKPARNGYEFQPRITMTGKATVSAFRMHAIEQEEPTTGCAEDEVDDSSAAEEETHVLAFIADWGKTDNDGQAQAVQSLVRSWTPEYIITGGDNKYGMTFAEVLAAMTYYASMVERELMFPTWGNHDTDDSGGIADILAHFPYLPGDQRNYDVVLGDAHFFFRETHDSGANPPSAAELTASANWLRVRLSASTARWKIVVTQDPPHTSAESNDYPGHAASQLDYYGWGADLVLSGDSHQYERFDTTCASRVPCIVCGLGGAVKVTGYRLPYVRGSAVRYAAKYGALKLTVSCSTLVVEFFNTDQELVDSLTLTQPTAAVDAPAGTELFRGVRHQALASGVHLVTVDVTTPGISFLTTAAGGTRDTVRATTLEYLESSAAQLAINAHFFLPYPSGDTDANIVGFGASAGAQTSPFEEQPIGVGYTDQSYAILPNAPALNISAQNLMSLLNAGDEASAWNAVSGSAQIITDGEVTIPTYGAGGLNAISGYSNSNSWYDETTGRTCVGYSRDGTLLLILVADVSPGLTVAQAANLLLSNGAYQAINLDGGNSAALAVNDGTARYLNDAPGVSVGSNLAIMAQAL